MMNASYCRPTWVNLHWPIERWVEAVNQEFEARYGLPYFQIA